MTSWAGGSNAGSRPSGAPPSGTTAEDGPAAMP